MNIIDEKALKETVEMVSLKEDLEKSDVINLLENEVFPKTLRQPFGKEAIIKVDIDPKSYKMSTYRMWNVVSDDSEEVNDLFEVRLSDVENKDSNFEVGDQIVESLENYELKRNNATIAKQLLNSSIQNLKKEKIKKHVLESNNNLINIIVRSYDLKKRIYRVDFNSEYSGILPFDNLINKDEKLKVGNNYWAAIDKEDLSNNIVFTRTGEEFIKGLFKKEIPEVYNEVIEVKDVYFNSDKKIIASVYTSDKNLDPIGSCVGAKGSRINSIIEHLNGGSIDLLKWSGNEGEYVVNLFKDLEIEKVIVEDNKIFVFLSIEDFENLSSQNKIRLKAINQFLSEKVILTTEEKYEQDNLYLIDYFSKELKLDEDSAEMVAFSGVFKSIDDIVEISPTHIAEILDIDEDSAKFLFETAQDKVSARNLKLSSIETNLKDLDSMNNFILEQLLNKGIDNMVDLSDLANDELCELIFVDLDKANELIMEARDIIYS
tara:strand:+ start:44146 stop:45612 length:1467 start_codon:yes stop_codon:yes gene_type:complete